MQQEQLDTTEFNAILGMVRAQSAWLDEIRQPCLLHGDLWLFNVLVSQRETGPQISGIIDADRAWWGDPMADWLMFSLAVRRDEPEWQEVRAAFWAAYGPPRNSQAAQFREAVYQTMHLGSVSLWCLQNQKTDDLKRAGDELHEVARRLLRVIE
jgi:aminoglycoside phosphotransferase (APT) family kinase protein